jgi:DNA-binding NarL/FixJ family response regulator
VWQESIYLEGGSSDAYVLFLIISHLPSEMANTPSYQIFLVDDHATIRQVLPTYIARHDGLEVCGTAASGEEALAYFASHSCDLAILDLSMPGMSGLDLLRYLREHYPAVKCLMLSGHTEPHHIEAALETGAHGYVPKGNPIRLIEAIRAVL